MPWGEICEDGTVRDQVWFCGSCRNEQTRVSQVGREVKQCEWDEWTINEAVAMNNLEMLKYCFSNGCPCDEEKSCKEAAGRGHLDCLDFFDKVDLEETEKKCKKTAAYGHLEIVKYFVEERNITDAVKIVLSAGAAKFGRPDCLEYLVEEAKLPPDYCEYIATPLLRARRVLKLLARKGSQNQRTENTLILSRNESRGEEEHSD